MLEFWIIALVLLVLALVVKGWYKASRPPPKWVCTNCFNKTEGHPKSTFLMARRITCRSCNTRFEAPCGKVARVILWIAFPIVSAMLVSGYFTITNAQQARGIPAFTPFEYFLKAGGWLFTILSVGSLVAIIKDIGLRQEYKTAIQRSEGLSKDPSARPEDIQHRDA